MSAKETLMAAAGVNYPTFVASARTQNPTAGTSLVITKPTGTLEGDLMVAFMGTNNDLTWTGATGWTEVADQGAKPSLRIAYKVAGPAEGANYTFTSSGSGTLSGCILTYRNAAYDTIAGAFTTGTDPLVLSSITVSAAPAVLIAVAARVVDSLTIAPPAGMTARVTDDDATFISYVVCDQSVSVGATGTRSVTVGSTGNASGIMLALKPA